MRDWYAEGLIDKNFTAGSAAISGDYSNFENDQTLFLSFWFNFLMGKELYTQGYVSNDDLDLQPLGGIVLNKGDDPVKCSGNACIQQEIYVTTQAKDKIDIISKWLDYQYTQEGINYRYYGIENESYVVDETGNITFTDAILKNPDGISVSDALGKYAMRTYMGFQSETAEISVQVATSSDGAIMQIKAGEVWASPEETISIPVGVQL